MSDKRLDIGDDEIRVIAPNGNQSPRNDRKRKSMRYVYAAIAIIAAAAAAIVLPAVFRPGNANEAEPEDVSMVAESETGEVLRGDTEDQAININAEGDIDNMTADNGRYASRRDTTVNGTRLIILTPHGAIPTLEVGNSVVADTTVILAAQAADIRRDNGEIAGTYVLKGELLSKGEAKAGYCSIVNGEINIGVADATPMLEQVLMSGGYFFRQYPLVAAGQLIENKPQGKARRKALAEIDGTMSVVMSTDKLTFHDFSQALIDAGARNAIYLVGANSTVFYNHRDGRRHFMGPVDENAPDNINYIVWR
ncbi:MAG: phosphodiester glycosidase family protein [Muribaculaceae bacterium]|nr:phosphodiester glycosidase family protein [Muribaculaceae bacterium]